MRKTSPYSVTNIRRRSKGKKVGYVKDTEYVVPDTGELKDGYLVVEEPYEVDGSRYIKLYDPSRLIGLSSCAVSVLMYIMQKLKYTGWASVAVEKAMEYTGYQSKQSVYRGLSELEHADIITKRDSSSYWANPNVFYKGKRPVDED